jgi:hypothetical protein
MTAFANAVQTQETRTENGMKALTSTGKACVDLFYKIGASRGKNIIPEFSAARAENPELALRIALWARDVRGGAGERQLFCDILQYLERTNVKEAEALMRRIPMLGRWDDVLSFITPVMQDKAFTFIGEALKAQEGLCAKWMPRKGDIAVQLRKHLGLTPKEYRKTLVNLTQVVETQMCAKDWDNINFSHVPSLAAARYRTAFFRNTPKFKEYVDALVAGDPAVKVNAAAVYPYDVLKSLFGYIGSVNATDKAFIVKQWEALPNFVGDANILPMVDVSGSMRCPAAGSLMCLEVAVSLGLYCADKNTGAFKDLVLTFSGSPKLVKLLGDVVQKTEQLKSADWGMNTDISRAFDKVLDTAVSAKVPASEMPKMLLIFSDMQFDRCAAFDDSAMQMAARKFNAAGYELPKIVFWNLNAQDNAPVKSTEAGVALVSGFSPALMQALLAGDLSEFTPEAIMLKTVMSDRYNF